jgi:hypothetical protein
MFDECCIENKIPIPLIWRNQGSGGHDDIHEDDILCSLATPDT